MIFKTKNGDTIECTPSEFLELAAAMSAVKAVEADKSEFDGYCSMKDDCCELCKEHNANCTDCPNNYSNYCYYDEETDECGDEPNYAEKPTKVSIEDMCPRIGQYCEQCARHNGKCLDCGGCLEYADCPVLKMVKGEDDEDVEEEEEDEAFIFNDIFIGHPETTDGQKLISNYIFKKFEDNYFYDPDIVVTCTDNIPEYNDYYVARDKAGYAVLFKDPEAFIKAMRDNGIAYNYFKVYHDDHDENASFRFFNAELKTCVEWVSKLFGGLKNE